MRGKGERLDPPLSPAPGARTATQRWAGTLGWEAGRGQGGCRSFQGPKGGRSLGGVWGEVNWSRQSAAQPKGHLGRPRGWEVGCPPPTESLGVSVLLLVSLSLLWVCVCLPALAP